MLKIVSAMKPEERHAIRRDQTNSEALWPKLLELEKLGKGYCLFEELEDVLDLLDGKEGAKEDHEEYEDFATGEGDEAEDGGTYEDWDSEENDWE
jgi:hypothetical protein